MFLTLYSNSRGEVFEDKETIMLGRNGTEWVVPDPSEMMPLPKGATLVTIPGYMPVGIGEDDNLTCLQHDPHNPQDKVTAVAALLPQGFTRTLLPACLSENPEEAWPLFGYAAVGWHNEKIYVSAVQTDEHRRWHPAYYNTDGLPARINRLLNKYPENRILRQLARCSLEYGCFTAQNLFYQRWEAGIPSINVCNASCLGCISESHIQAAAPQNRLDFRPEINEIVEIGTEHLANARQPIISFGQGCEGEPSLNASRLAPAIERIRSRTDQGLININTNAGYYKGIARLCDAGLDSMRVTIFSCREENYNKYHRPRDYTLADVKRSINYAREKGVTISLNLLVFPGFTDREQEVQGLLDFIAVNPVNMIQMRNLNFDPDLLFKQFPGNSEVLGINNFLNLLKQEIPQVKIGSYTHL
ncbi:MAG: radical SAM protein [Syntrophomonadaceae bacterium]